MQSAIISRFPAAVEPEPRHDRPTTPDPAPHPHAAAAMALSPEQRLHREVAHRVATGDALIPQERRAPRTLSEKRARLAQVAAGREVA